MSKQRRLLAGDVPSAIDPPSGCRFHTRCPYVEERCKREEPPVTGDFSGTVGGMPFAATGRLKHAD